MNFKNILQINLYQICLIVLLFATNCCAFDLELLFSRPLLFFYPKVDVSDSKDFFDNLLYLKFYPIFSSELSQFNFLTKANSVIFDDSYKELTPEQKLKLQLRVCIVQTLSNKFKEIFQEYLNSSKHYYKSKKEIAASIENYYFSDALNIDIDNILDVDIMISIIDKIIQSCFNTLNENAKYKNYLFYNLFRMPTVFSFNLKKDIQKHQKLIAERNSIATIFTDFNYFLNYFTDFLTFLFFAPEKNKEKKSTMVNFLINKDYSKFPKNTRLFFNDKDNSLYAQVISDSFKLPEVMQYFEIKIKPNQVQNPILPVQLELINKNPTKPPLPYKPAGLFEKHYENKKMAADLVCLVTNLSILI